MFHQLCNVSKGQTEHVCRMDLARGHQLGTWEAQETEKHPGKHVTLCLEGCGWRLPEGAWGRAGQLLVGEETSRILMFPKAGGS